MWRPKDWENPHPDLTEVALTEKYLIQAMAMEGPKSDHEIYEAGADAILQKVNEYLIPYGIEFSEGNAFHSTGHRYEKKGKDLYLVIPRKEG